MNRKLLLLPAMFLALLVTAGCGDGAKKAKIESFTATPSIVPTEGGETTLVWQVRNADEIEIFPDVGVVTGTSLTLVVSETTEFELVAKRKGHRSHKTTTVLVQGPNTVVGTVRSMLNGTTMPGAVIVIDGHDAELTNDDGQFAIADVSTPYQLTVLFPTDNVFVVYDGLTRFDPIIDVPFSFDLTGIQRDVSLSGVVTGAAVPGTTTYVSVDTPLFFDPGATTASTTDGTWSNGATWLDGPTSTQARIHAIRAGGVSPPDSYLYGTTTVDITDQDVLTNVNLTMTSAGTATTTFRYSNYDFYGIDSATQLILFGTPTGTAADEGFALPFDAAILNDTAGEISVTTPDLDGTSLVFGLSYTDLVNNGFAWDVRTVPVGTEEVDVTLRPVPWALLPVHNGVIEPDAPFAIGGPSDAAVIWMFEMQGAVDNTVMVVSASTNIHLPDLTKMGLSYDNVDYIDWGAFSVAPRASIDDVAGPGGILGNNPTYFGVTDSQTAILNPNAVP